MLCLRHVPILIAFLVAGSFGQASEAAKLLPADTEVIVTVNLRQAFFDHRQTNFVQRYLDQYRLALTANDQQLKKYYQVQELQKSEGISGKAFLTRCETIKSVCDALGVDPLEDIDRLTLGLKRERLGPPKNAGFHLLIIEGRFHKEKFKAGMERICKAHFGSLNVSPNGEIWQFPDQPDGMCLTLLSPQVLVIADGKKNMDTLLAQAGGKLKTGLTKGTRSLLEHAQQQHIGIVLADADSILNPFVDFLKNEVAPSVGEKEVVGKFIVGQGADWLQKFARDLSSASAGFSLRDGDLKLQVGVELKKAENVAELTTLLRTGNFLSVLALKASNNEIAQQLATIVLRQRIVAKETTVFTEIEVPYEFVKLVAKGPWLALLSKEFATTNPPSPIDALSAASLDAAMTRITGIRVYKLPTDDKAKRRPSETSEVLEMLDIPYRGLLGDPHRHRLDMYLPKNKKNFPVVVLVHGGAWVLGDNCSGGLYSSVGQFLATQGIGVVMPNYRLSPGVKHPEHIKDVAHAVAWTHANIAKHGGDPQRLFLAGHSAGGHLVALLASDESYLKAEGLKTANIKGVIAVSGVYKIPPGVMRFSFGGDGPRAVRLEQQWPLRGDSEPSWKFQLPGLPAQINMFAPVFGETPEACANASPITHVRKELPPILLLLAEHDLPTLSEMAEEFHDKLRQEGCDVRLLRMQKRNHNSLMFSAIIPTDPAAEAILTFLRNN